jgi:multicomponent K+:H+ antiporter subunit F
MLNVALSVAFVAVGLALALALWRLLRGPGRPDRILALDTLAINTLALVMLLGLGRANAGFFEVALLIAMMGFVGTAALCRFLLGGKLID